MGAGRPFIDHCQICGEALEPWARRKVTLSGEYARKMENGKYESRYRAYRHAAICHRCAQDIDNFIEGMRSGYSG